MHLYFRKISKRKKNFNPTYIQYNRLRASCSTSPLSSSLLLLAGFLLCSCCCARGLCSRGVLSFSLLLGAGGALRTTGHQRPAAHAMATRDARAWPAASRHRIRASGERRWSLGEKNSMSSQSTSSAPLVCSIPSRQQHDGTNQTGNQMQRSAPCAHTYLDTNADPPLGGSSRDPGTASGGRSRHTPAASLSTDTSPACFSREAFSGRRRSLRGVRSNGAAAGRSGSWSSSAAVTVRRLERISRKRRELEK